MEYMTKYLRVGRGQWFRATAFLLLTMHRQRPLGGAGFAKNLVEVVALPRGCMTRGSAAITGRRYG